jgi:hypothetical protein
MMLKIAVLAATLRCPSSIPDLTVDLPYSGMRYVAVLIIYTDETGKSSRKFTGLSLAQDKYGLFWLS